MKGYLKLGNGRMINKRKAVHLFREFGDAVVEFTNKTPPALCTTDFNNKYIKKIKRKKIFPLKGNILVFNWTENEFQAIPTKYIKKLTPLNSILGNKKDG